MKKELRLSQIIAIEKTINAKVTSGISTRYHSLQKHEMSNGQERIYIPLDDDGEQLDPESKKVQVNVKTTLDEMFDLWSEGIDITASKDYGNCDAYASVVVDDVTIIERAPVTFLLFLEKKLQDVHTAIAAAPTLDVAHNWATDSNSGLFKSESSKKVKTKKVPEKIVLYPHQASEHGMLPAQVELVHNDVTVGHWITTLISGALPEPDKDALLKRINKLSIAVKEAREEANTMKVNSVNVSKNIFNFILGNQAKE